MFLIAFKQEINSIDAIAVVHELELAIKRDFHCLYEVNVKSIN